MRDDLLLLMDEKRTKYLVEPGKDLHCSKGMVRAADISGIQPGQTVKSNTGHVFHLLKPTILDYISKAKRAPASMTLKDMSIAAGYACLNSGSKVLESGTGSGLFTMFLAHNVFPETVVTYEIREDFSAVALGNFERFEIGNIHLELRDIYEGIGEKDLDAVFLDLAEPWRVVPHLKDSLKIGGKLVSFSPSINQSRQLEEVLLGYNVETFEAILRHWKTDKMRPDTRMLGHTGFLTVARRIE